MKPDRLELCNIGPFTGIHCIEFSHLDSLFLITGKTGSGKTTIFDSIAYALYGKPLGSRKIGKGKSLRSHFSTEHDAAYVQLSFFIKEKKYRITRSCPYIKEGNKNETPETVLFEVIENNTWKNLSSANKSETDKTIESCMQLSHDEFSKIIILPQGEFAAFLKSTSKEKSTTLKAIFPVRTYTAVMDKAKNKADRITDELKIIEKNIADMHAEFNPHEYIEKKTQLENDIHILKEKKMTVDMEIRNKIREIEHVKNIQKQQNEYIAATETLNQLHEHESEIAMQEKKLIRARQAAPLAVQIFALAKIALTFSQAEKRIEKKESERTAAYNTSRQLKNSASLMQEKKEASELLAAYLNRLEDAVIIFEEINTAAKKAISQNRILKEKSTELELQIAAVNTLHDDISNVTRTSDRYDTLVEQLNTVKPRELYLQNVLECIDTFETAQEKKAGYNENLKCCQEKLTAVKKKAAELEDTAALLRAEKNAFERNEKAASLASELTPNSPCPVCGSTHHPQVAKSKEVNVSHLDRKITVAEASYNETKKDVEKLDVEVHELQTKLYHVNEESMAATTKLSQLAEKYHEITTVYAARPDRLQAESDYSEIQKNRKDIEEAIADARDAGKEKKELEQRLQVKKNEEIVLADEIYDFRTRLAETESSLKEKENQYSRLILPVPDTLMFDSTYALEHPYELRETSRNKNNELYHEISQYELEITEIEKLCTQLDSEIMTLRVEYRRSQTEISSQKQQVSAACLRAGFNDTEDAEEAVLSEMEMKHLEENIRQFNEKKHSTTEIIDRLKKKIGDEVLPDIAGMEQEAALFTNKQTKIENEITETYTVLQLLKNQQHQYQNLAVRQEQLLNEANIITSLSNELNGKNAKKIPFDTWMLAAFLQEVIAYANIRLQKMSSNRYHMLVDEEGSDKRGSKGLDVTVFDSFTGHSRPSATLSGGETFMAAISLALGLADTIQMRSGGIHLDALFIDEGFGSLDESSLERAMSILDDLRNAAHRHCIIGIISHVDELKSRIPSKIEIKKANFGSQIV